MTVVAGNASMRGLSTRPLPGRMATSPVGAALAAYGVALVWTLLVQLPFLGLDRIDEVFYVEVAHLWAKGVLPYVGAFDVKPPGFFALVAATQFVLGPTPASTRAVAIALDAATATALFFLGRRGSARVGLFAAAVYPPLSQLICFNDFYSALGAATTLAFLAALSPLRLTRRAALTGLAAGAAFCIKQTSAFEAAVLFFMLVGARDAVGARIRTAAAFLCGWGLVPLAFITYFACCGAAKALFDDAIVRAAIRPASPAEGLSFVEGVQLFLPTHRSVLLLFLLAGLAVARSRMLGVALPRAPVGVFAAWLLAAMVATLAQRSLHVSYIGQELPPALLLAGLCAEKAIPELGRMSGRARLGVLAALTLAPPLGNFGGHWANRRPTHAIAVATAAIRATQPSESDRLFAVNGGMWLNATTDLDPPTKYIHPSHILCPFDGQSEENLDDALAAAPRYLVVANPRKRMSCERSERWEKIDDVLRARYRLVARAADDSDSFDLYERAAATH